MKWFRNLKTGTKIIALVVLMAIFLASVGFIGFYYSKQSNDNTNSIYSSKLLAISYIKEERADSRNIQNILYRLFLAPLTKDEEQQLQSQMKNLAKQYDQNMQNYKQIRLDPHEAESVLKLDDEVQQYRDEREKALQMVNNGDKLGGYKYFIDQAVPYMENTNNILQDLSDYNEKSAKQLLDQSNQNFVVSTKIVIGISVAAILLAIVIGLVIAQMIANPLIAMVAHVGEIAVGNLTIEDVKVNSKDEIGELGMALNTMVGNLRRLIKQVTESAESVASSSEALSSSAEQQAQATNQVAVAIQGVAGGTEKQNTAIDETSTAIEQISAAIQEVAASSNEVAGQATQTSSVAKEGQQAVDRAVNQMNKIGYVTAEVQGSIDQLAMGSKKIGEITDVISGIADQTNLLALNAAIEAARAGENGRGFAVVAEEVRKLAEQSLEAAKQITSLINENQTNIDNAVRAMQAGTNDVQTGVEVVTSAGETFVKIADSINQVVNQIQEVSATVEEMASGSQQIVSFIRQIENISKENMDQTQTVSAATEEQTASVEQIASASQSLAKMAQDLQVVVSTFHV